jgi:hypothetical protein
MDLSFGDTSLSEIFQILVHRVDINALTAHNTHSYSKVFLLETNVLKCQKDIFKNKLTLRELPLILFAVSLTTIPQILPKRVLHTVRSSASSFSFQYPILSLRSFISCLLLLSCLSVTSILPSIFHSITCFRRQFLRKM